MIAGQFRTREWRDNPDRHTRTIEEALEVARGFGVHIPDDVAFFVDELGELDEKGGSWGQPLFFVSSSAPSRSSGGLGANGGLGRVSLNVFRPGAGLIRICGEPGSAIALGDRAHFPPLALSADCGRHRLRTDRGRALDGVPAYSRSPRL
jgi:hypothetical protein